MIAADAQPRRPHGPPIAGPGAAFAPGLRFVEVRGDRFEPAVRRGDYVLVGSVDGWRGEADYLVEIDGEPSLYRCTALGTREQPITMGSSNPLYGKPWLMSRADFEAAVVGIVVMFCQVKQHALLHDLVPVI